MHIEDQKAAGGLTSLGVTSEEGSYLQLSSGMSASNLNHPILSISFIIHSESASGCDALKDSIAKANPEKSAPRIDLNVLSDKAKYVSEGLETVLTAPETGKGAKDDPIIMVDESEEDKEDKDEGIHANSNVETEDTLVPRPPSP
nr:hypothetical protein [Tanacetum cinerariifolium]